MEKKTSVLLSLLGMPAFVEFAAVLMTAALSGSALSFMCVKGEPEVFTSEKLMVESPIQSDGGKQKAPPSDR
jgi:hypothetical protein